LALDIGWLANPADAHFSLSTSVPDGTDTGNAATGRHSSIWRQRGAMLADRGGDHRHQRRQEGSDRRRDDAAGGNADVRAESGVGGRLQPQ